MAAGFLLRGRGPRCEPDSRLLLLLLFPSLPPLLAPSHSPPLLSRIAVSWQRWPLLLSSGAPRPILRSPFEAAGTVPGRLPGGGVCVGRRGREWNELWVGERDEMRGEKRRRGSKGGERREGNTSNADFSVGGRRPPQPRLPTAIQHPSEIRSRDNPTSSMIERGCLLTKLRKGPSKLPLRSDMSAFFSDLSILSMYYMRLIQEWEDFCTLYVKNVLCETRTNANLSPNHLPLLRVITEDDLISKYEYCNSGILVTNRCPFAH